MGTSKDKKEPAKDAPPKTTDAPAAAPPTTAPAAGLDFAALDAAFDKAENAQDALMDRRAVGVREVLGNLNEADSPSLADELLKTLAIAALGFASGYVTAAVTAKLAASASVALANAIQSGLDDGLKDAATKVAGKLAEVDGQSKPTFFASQEEGLIVLKQAAADRITDSKLAAKGKVKAAAPEAQADEMSTHIKAAEQFRTAANLTAEAARQTQYQQSLSKWMNALSQSALGQSEGGNTNLGKAVGMTPTDHYKQQGARGVIYVAFGQHPASRPFAVSGKRATIKIAGMTSAARERIKHTPIKDLGMPIVASGYVYDGFLDGLSVAAGDNEISFGKNEGGGVWVKGDSDAFEALKKAANKTSASEAAEVILNEDIGISTLEHAHTG
ncbi:MAG: hypothetical protein M3680_06980 [Myxococcota bacterium]|nr:hypothetical protein [Myxococcota bacterium]